jgi:hypothetical protein
MKRSTDWILTTHTGSLVHPREIVDIMRQVEAGQPYRAAELHRLLTPAGARAGRCSRPLITRKPRSGDASFPRSSASAACGSNTTGVTAHRGPGAKRITSPRRRGSSAPPMTSTHMTPASPPHHRWATRCLARKPAKRGCRT